jgi:putative Mg2+ transporter-C (MgtC) family protein
MIESTLFLVQIVLAVVLGALIGLEREAHDRPAGLRTHMLVCMGAAVFTIAALNFSMGEGDSPSFAINIAANIVVGIGFIGGGAIFKAENKVKGLTTAADLWVIAAVGMLVGLGSYLNAVAAAALIYVVLVLGRKLREKVPKSGTDEDS